MEQAATLLENSTVISPVNGRVQDINESGVNNQGEPAAYITIQEVGSYRVKGVLGELQRGGIQEGVIFIPILIVFIAFKNKLLGNVSMGGIKE